ncbi:MAG: hypothetical protein GY703_22305 [Gammaproteobacteria bacterium]|nr:hypothetical protein [Gammaproteobacteria bacterium]
MLLNPSIMALILVSVIVSGLLLLVAGFSLQLLRYWDINSGSERQLKLERRTYLISTILAYCFVAELVSLLLFIYNAEQMSGRFVGAMCATGVLNINGWGWPTLYLKISLFFAGAVWLIINRIDNQAHDYPLIRIKYAALFFILPLAVAEAVVQTTFFIEMEPDVITSCCGALFSPEGEGVAAEVSSIEPSTSLVLLVSSALASLAIGGWVLLRRKGGLAFAATNAATFLIALLAIVSCIALYVYEHPHHHCPFCILKSGHDFVGYALYIPLFLGTALALSVGAISPFQKVESLKEIIPLESRNLIRWSMGLMVVFYLIAAWSILSSNLTMMGVWW